MNVVVFTGAGISRESGLQTFRDREDGLWQGFDLEEVASVEGWRKNPAKVLEFYNMRRRQVLAAAPNAAHLAIAEFGKRHQVRVITQNVDDLHERAGSARVLHLHGEILKVRADQPGSKPFAWQTDLHLGDLDPHCGRQLRPHVVWFGEDVPEYETAIREVRSRHVDAIVVVGTSLNVYPAAWIATESAAPVKILVDPNPPDCPVVGFTVIQAVASAGVPRALMTVEQRAHP